MTIIRGPAKSGNFSVVVNSIIRDKSISYRARGILIRLLSNAENFSMDAHDLAAQGREGRGAILSGLKELRDAGYLVTTKVRGKNGQISTINYIYEIPRISSTEAEV